MHMDQVMPMSLTVSCLSKSRLVLPSWFYLSGNQLTRIVPDKIQRSTKCSSSNILSHLRDILRGLGTKNLKWVCDVTKPLSVTVCHS